MPKNDDLGLGLPVEIDWKQFVAIFPNWLDKPNTRVRALVDALNKALKLIAATTPQIAAFFIAQVGHETGNFVYDEEIASGAAYEGRKDLGNTQPGDGKRYKGRGWIQLTGRANYAAAGKALGLPLEARPDLADDPGVACMVSAWYWNSRGLTARAIANDFASVTLRINGGYNGWADRVRIYRRACTALGIQPLVLADTPPTPKSRKP